MNPILGMGVAGLKPVGVSEWSDGRDLTLSARYLSQAPDLPAPLDRPELLRDGLARSAADAGGLLIEAETGEVDSLPAVRQVVKRGTLFVASWTVPRRLCALVLEVSAVGQFEPPPVPTAPMSPPYPYPHPYPYLTSDRHNCMPRLGGNGLPHPTPALPGCGPAHPVPEYPVPMPPVPPVVVDRAEQERGYSVYWTAVVSGKLAEVAPTVVLTPMFKSFPPFTGPEAASPASPGPEAEEPPARRRWFRRG